jgi:HTH-type transcriptional regulator, sugar sensing transcriptional regulator
MEMIKELKELNLEDNEVKVYLACLYLGSAKVNDISKKAELIRTTTYGVLKSLIEKGLVSTIIKNNITYFQATRPKQLLEILEEKKKRINSILPQLEKIQEVVPNKHKVELFEGKEGLKTIFNEFVSKPNQEVKIIGFFSKWLDFFGSWTEIYYRKKKEQKTKTLVLVDESERNYAKDNRISNSQIKYIKDLDIESECFIYGDKVALVSFEKDNLKGVVIQDKEISKMQNILFDKLWKQAKP